MMNKLVLLHGALGATDQLAPLKQALSQQFEVLEFGFSGHGGRPALGPCSVPQYASEFLDWLSERSMPPPWVLGYSLGGYVALYLESIQKGSLRGVATLATKFHWSPQEADREMARLDPKKLEEKAPAFVEELKQRHAPSSWTSMVEKTAGLMRDLGDSPLLDEHALSSIEIPVMTIIGDRDRMVRLEETQWAYQQLSKGSFAVLPSTNHPMEAMPLDLLSALMNHWVQRVGRS